MITKDVLRQIIAKQKKELFTTLDVVRREALDAILPWFKDKRIITLTGIRRCGKSTLLKQIMQNKSEWCYVNFEDERLLDFQAQDFEMIHEILIEIYGPSKIYFFDEIQNIEKLNF